MGVCNLALQQQDGLRCCGELSAGNAGDGNVDGQGGAHDKQAPAQHQADEPVQGGTKDPLRPKTHQLHPSGWCAMPCCAVLCCAVLRCAALLCTT